MTRTSVSFRLLAVCLALSTLGDPAGAAGSKDAAEKLRAVAEPNACVLAYRSSLARIAVEDLPLLRSAPTPSAAPAGSAPQEAASDGSLPGMPLFVPPSRQRSAAEMAALTAAVALARSRGRSATVAGAGTDTERTWIAARLREDLGDYLNQKPTPFLCSGVPAYLDTMRKFAARLGPMNDRRPEWIATQRSLAERSVTAATAAITRTRANAPQAVSQTDLRPGADLSRTEAVPARPQPPIGDENGILAAIDRLVAETRSAGLVSDPATPQITGSTIRPVSPSRPVLAKLAALRPLVASARPLISDRTVRLKLLTAFADLEMLDYLGQAKAQAADPVAAAIGRTLDRIGQAHEADCTCSN